MRIMPVLPLAAILLLAACEGSGGTKTADKDAAFTMNVADDDDEDGAVAVKAGEGGVSIKSPAFSGSLAIPGLKLGGAHMDIDGMKPFPGTSFSSVNVDARDSAGGEDHGTVKMDFTAPAAPDKVLAYYVGAAKDAGFDTPGVSGGTVSGSKQDGSRFTVSAAPADGGSTGTLVMTDTKGADMPIEMVLLGATLLLALVHIFAAAHFKTKEYGLDWNMGARDESLPPPKSPIAGRLQRAQANLYETLPLFIGALLGAFALGRLGFKTNLGAHLYFFGRLIYLPLYAAGIPKIRTLIWAVAMIGLLLIIWAMLFG